MFAIGRTTRFAVFPAFQIGRLSVVHFSQGKRKLSFHSPKTVSTKGCLRDLYALNIGRFLFLYESAAEPHVARPHPLSTLQTSSGQQ